MYGLSPMNCTASTSINIFAVSSAMTFLSINPIPCAIPMSFAKKWMRHRAIPGPEL
jgi:hypothetical protein